MSNNHDIEANQLARMQRRLARTEKRVRMLHGCVAAILVAGVLLWAPFAMSEPDAPVETEYPDLYHFSPNTPAIAAEVNSNFATLHARADSNTQSINGHTQSIDSHAGRIGSNEQAITNLQSGKLDSDAIQRHGPYHVERNNRAGTSRKTMIPTHRSLCFLIKVNMEDVDADHEQAQCNIVASNGDWILEGYLQATQDTDVRCSARCISW